MKTSFKCPRQLPEAWRGGAAAALRRTLACSPRLSRGSIHIPIEPLRRAASGPAASLARVAIAFFAEQACKLPECIANGTDHAAVHQGGAKALCIGCFICRRDPSLPTRAPKRQCALPIYSSAVQKLHNEAGAPTALRAGRCGAAGGLPAALCLQPLPARPGLAAGEAEC